MGLVDLRTDLKSIKFGKDTVGGGNSNQPYIVRDIPESFQDVGRTGGPDFLLRGGTLLPRRGINDTSRMVQMLFDFKSINGPLFIAKQNVLSLTNVNTAVGYESFTEEEDQSGGSAVGNFIRNNLALNQGIYTPASTIASTVGNPFGIHPNKQGLNPFNPNLNSAPGDVQTNPPGLTLPTYVQIVDGGADGKKSRLLNFLSKINEKPSSDNSGANTLYEYTGGPGATLGVGKTVIDMLNDQRTGINNTNALRQQPKITWSSGTASTQFQSNFQPDSLSFGSSLNSPFSTSPPSPFGNTSALSTPFSNTNSFRRGVTSYTTLDLNPSPTTTSTNDDILNSIVNDQFIRVGASVAYLGNTFILSGDIDKAKEAFLGDGRARKFSIYEDNNDPFSLVTKIDNIAFKSGIGDNTQISTFTQEQIAQYIPTSKNNIEYRQSFTTDIPEVDSNELIPNVPDYVQENIEKRVNLGNPGRKGNLKSYTFGKNGTSLDPNNAGSVLRKPLDKITGMPLYKSSGVIQNEIKNDLVKFRIGVIDNNNPTEKTYIHFRAFIDSLSDAYSSDWSSQKFMGRAESFYKFQGFERSISIGWTVAAQSKQELIPMYQKLNYLASSLSGDYSPEGFMRGNLITLTMGGWFYEQPGFITGMTLDVDGDSPWDIAINDTGNSDSTVKELPMIIKVSGFSFTPIHEFVPRVQQNSFNNSEFEGAGANWIESYGRERYLALNNGKNNNYDAGKDGFNYTPQKPLS